MSEIGLLLHIANTAASDHECVRDPQLAEGLTSLFKRAELSLSIIKDFLMSHLIKDPRSLDDDTRQLELRWNVWLLRGKGERNGRRPNEDKADNCFGTCSHNHDFHVYLVCASLGDKALTIG